MTYREFAPSPALGHVVRSLWLLDGPAIEGAIDPILPDGHSEIIVHGGAPFVERRGDGSDVVQGRLLFAGQLTRAARVAPSGRVLVAGARLLPAAARRLVRMPQHELADRIVDLDRVDRRLARFVAHEVAGAVDGPSLVAALDRGLRRAIVSTARSTPVEVATAVACARRGLVRVDDLCRVAGVGPRQLERAFRDEVGIGPKRLLRVVRFQHVLHAVRWGGAGGGWAGLAATHGFYDQSHFVRDFRSFTGDAPTDWSIQSDSLTAFFSSWHRDAPGARPGPAGPPDVGFVQDTRGGGDDADRGR
jgi:AraC-like DNA-binding protein